MCVTITYLSIIYIIVCLIHAVAVKLIPDDTPSWKVPILQKRNKEVIGDFLVSQVTRAFFVIYVCF